MMQYGGRLDTSSLRTIFYKAMAIVNCRPLSHVTDEMVPLTPNMILTMKKDVVLPPPGQFEEADIYNRKRWRQVQHIANEFWHRWKREYLHMLQPRQKWVTKRPQINIGDIVVVNESDAVRNNWRMAKVVDCIKSHDGLVRSVRLLMGNSDCSRGAGRAQYMERPIAKIVVLVESDVASRSSSKINKF